MHDHGTLVSGLAEQEQESARFLALALEQGPSRLAALGFEPGPFQEKLPWGAWANIAAWMQLTEWYLEGLGPYLPGFLPTPTDAGLSIVRQIVNPEGYTLEPEERPLVVQVICAWLRSFVWAEGTPRLLFDAVDDEDGFVETLAQFLWRHRDLVRSDEENGK